VAERVLWSTRLLLVVAVAGSAVLAVAVLWLATVDLVRFLGDVADDTPDENANARGDLVCPDQWADRRARAARRAHRSPARPLGVEERGDPGRVRRRSIGTEVPGLVLSQF
jgi:hypothetical protein